jgi:hypothetical protein
VRLDHLLSKEHVQSASDRPVYRRLKDAELTAKSFRRHTFSGGAHGWNIDIVTRMKTWTQYVSFGRLEQSESEPWSSARCWVLRDRASLKQTGHDLWTN